MITVDVLEAEEDVPTVLTLKEPEPAPDVVKKKSQEPDDPSKCSVCQEAAGKHSYYGQ